MFVSPKRLHRSRCGLAEEYWLARAQGTIIRWQSRSPREGAILGVPGSTRKHKALSVTAAFYVAKKNNNGVTAPLLQRTAMLPTGRCHITLSPPWKSVPCDAAFCQNSLNTCYEVLKVNVECVLTDTTTLMKPMFTAYKWPTDLRTPTYSPRFLATYTSN